MGSVCGDSGADSLAHKLKRLTMSWRCCFRPGTEWHLAPPGAHECDTGLVAQQSECEAAVAQLAASKGHTPALEWMIMGSGGSCEDRAWGQVPLGCSTKSGSDWTAHYKTSGGMPAGCIHQKYQLVCSGGACGPPARHRSRWPLAAWPKPLQSPSRSHLRSGSPAAGGCP